MKARTIMVALFVAAATTVTFAQEPSIDNENAPMAQEGPRPQRGKGGQGAEGRPQMQGQRPDGQGQECQRPPMGGIMALGFDEDQMAKVKVIESDFKKTTITLKAEVKVAEIDLNNELYAENSNTKKITELTNLIAKKNGELLTAKNNRLLAIKGLCNEEQLAKLAKMPQNGGPRHHRQAPNGQKEEGGKRGGEKPQQGRPQGERPNNEGTTSSQ